MGSGEQSNYGVLLQRARERGGLTRDQLAKRVGLNVSHLFRIETGTRRPSRDSALALAVALDLDDETVNRWLVAAGYAPVPALGAVREVVRTAGAVRTRGTARSKLPGVSGTGSWDAGVRARRLELLGLTESTIARLLDAMATSDLTLQREAASAVSAAFALIVETLESPVRTAVIPAAGWHHRVLAPHAIQRLLLGVIGEAVQAGIREIVLVLSPGGAESLYPPLKQAMDLALIPMVRLHCCEQPMPEGLGDAVLRAEAYVGNGPFVVLLPDDVVCERAGQSISRELRRMIGGLRDLGGVSLVAVCPVPKSRLAHCGAARLGSKAIHERIFPILQVVEKPARESPILNARNVLGIVGRYVLQPSVFAALRNLSGRGIRPLELTDALAMLLSGGARVCAHEIETKRNDVGAVLDEASGLIGNRSPKVLV
jgi:UTP--glucose-1-phosphate uridylyltransferase